MHDVFIHPTAMIDEGAKIGAKCTLWHFSHIMSGASLGDSCNIGQNVMVAPRVIIGNNVKIQNNVSVYEGVVCEDDVFLGPSCVFTNVRNPRSAISRRGKYERTIVPQRSHDWCKRYYRVWCRNRQVRLHRGRGCCDTQCSRLRAGRRCAGTTDRMDE